MCIYNVLRYLYSLHVQGVELAKMAHLGSTVLVGMNITDIIIMLLNSLK